MFQCKGDLRCSAGVPQSSPVRTPIRATADRPYTIVILHRSRSWPGFHVHDVHHTGCRANHRRLVVVDPAQLATGDPRGPCRLGARPCGSPRLYRLLGGSRDGAVDRGRRRAQRRPQQGLWPAAGRPGDRGAVRHEHLPTAVVARPLLLRLPVEPADNPVHRLAELHQSPHRRPQGTGAVGESHQHGDVRGAHRFGADGRRLPAGGAVLQAVSVAPIPADPGADADDAVGGRGRRVLLLLL